MKKKERRDSAGAVPHGEVERDGDDAPAPDRLLQAAEALFIERGYDGTSARDVASLARVNKALVFYYFKSKQGLFDAVLDRYYQAQTEALLAAFTAGGEIRDRIHAGIDAYLDFVERNLGYPRLIQREICSAERSLAKIRQYMEPLFLWGRTVLGEQFPERGTLAARHFFLSFFGMAINYYTYAPVLAPIWGTDPLSAPALTERRAHLHELVDALLDRYLTEDRE